MEHLPALFTDLALILILAGVVSLLFKKLRQPLVLGYIVAGFLAGKHMPYMPSVEDTGSVETWSQIGVIFLMFTLGLEFSFKKILRQGVKPVVTACLVMLCMMAVGNRVGRLFGWSEMDRLFLGGMLAMSSTTIIFKAFGDLGLMKKKFASKVLSVLVLEDILGILLMVVLSGVAVSQTLKGAELAMSLGKLGFFLVLWFVVGVFVIPTLLRHTKKLMNAETLLIFSVACCFLLVSIAASAGYSTAFGAFMMGSILAETVEAERIERLVAPVKDLFGAIFFVSVGMLVDPMVLVEYWKPILVLTVSILAGQAVLGTGCFLLTGNTLKTSVQCGFSLAQVGEFAFIIASMGLAMGVTSKFLYPVIVAVSIATTFLTPYMIRAAQAMDLPALTLKMPVLKREGTAATAWKDLLTPLAMQTAIYSVLAIAIIVLSLSTVLMFTRATFGHWVGNAVCGVLTLLAVAPFLRAIVMRKNHSDEWKTVAQGGKHNRQVLRLMLFGRFLLATTFIYYILDYLSPFRYYWHWLVAAGLMLIICQSLLVKKVSRWLEGVFSRNLSARDEAPVSSEAEVQAFARLLTAEDDYEHEAPIRLRHVKVRPDMPFCNQPLRESRLREDYACQVVGLEQADGTFIVPEAHHVLQQGEVLWLVGEKENLIKLLIE